jgi:hypothetical protein
MNDLASEHVEGYKLQPFKKWQLPFIYAKH